MRMNERICINGETISDEDFIEACQYFLNNPKFDDLDFLSILLLIFMGYALEKGVDMMICEVGIGGRLDPVNALPLTSGIISSIGWDHMDILGHSLEEIALEKAAICRSGLPLIVAEPKMPEEALKFLNKEKAAVFIQGKDYALEDEPSNLVWRFRDCEIKLAKSQLHPQVVGGALMLVKVLEKKFPVSKYDIVRAIEDVNIPGRME